MPCTLGKVCSRDTVDDSLQSHKSKKKKKKNAEYTGYYCDNSTEFGRHWESSDSVQHDNKLKTKGRKSVAGS